MTTLAPHPTPDPTTGSGPRVTVLADRCAGCQECLVRCPTAALALDPETWTVVADETRCVGCRQCQRTCPFSAIVVEGPTLVAPRIDPGRRHPAPLEGDRSETRRPIATWAEALAEAQRCLDCPDPTCLLGCPAHNDIPAFLRAIRDGDLDRAHQVLRQTTVLPDVCSRVCDQAVQCEGACSWSLAGAPPVAIGALERFVADNAPVPPVLPPEPGDPTADAEGLDVAIVGSGPAAIGAAAELVAAGAQVTVFERDLVPGGLLRWGIPDFTLPDTVARRPWEQLVAAGVTLHLGQAVEPEDLGDLAERFDAVVVATGAPEPLRPPVGQDLAGVLDASTFLRAAHDALHQGGSLPFLPEDRERPADAPARPARVLVLGGGNTAMDVARSAVRLGATAVCVDWMDRRFAPVRPDELEEAEQEGVEVRFSTTLERLEGEGGRVRRAVLAPTTQRSATERPRVGPGARTVEEVDLVVAAMGYRVPAEVAAAGAGLPLRKVVPDLPDRRWLGSGLVDGGTPAWARHQPVGRLALGRESLRRAAALPRQPRVWFVGDALSGPSTVVEAMTQGKVAAQAIRHHRPRRPDASTTPPRHVLVVAESRSGTTRALAEDLAGRLAKAGAEVRILACAEAGADALAWADLLVLGTWVEGALVAGVGPARRTRAWLAALPPLAGLPVATFCSYAFAPRDTLAQMRRVLLNRGGRILAEAAFRRAGRPHELGVFADRILAAIPQGARA
ncbi:FAD-dependent oxidoreductase [Aciditerrimonas ferrireducens]|jgi:glutamate synthase (NADPH/NADH) small chain|uniref:FAD-dependent oxidoreductase n=1 Tax=Aciditerrimonas ferrireducens TaxID=667306 RepID=UPI002003D831|nr:FAD-dependent oxidoreductase [Aciditerrimonas ferrireducens]MCK4177076.1 FAD-dependent oxidoreductase [Aciditerrimonas ferrireducens]